MRFRNLITFLFVCVLLSASRVPSVTAAGAIVSIGGSGGVDIPAGQTRPVAVQIAGVEGLYGFHLTLKFDPAVIQIVDANSDRPGVQMAPGDFLSLDFLVRNTVDNQAGVAEYILTQLNPSQAKSGSGTLFTLYVQAVRSGVSAVITADPALLSTRDGVAIPVETRPGELRLGAAATPVSSPTSLPTAEQPKLDMAVLTATPQALLVSTAVPPLQPSATAAIAAEATSVAVEPTQTLAPAVVAAPTLSRRSETAPTDVPATPVAPVAPVAVPSAQVAVSPAAAPREDPSATPRIVAAAPILASPDTVNNSFGRSEVRSQSRSRVLLGVAVALIAAAGALLGVLLVVRRGK